MAALGPDTPASPTVRPADAAARALALERIADAAAAVGSETSAGIDQSVSCKSTLSSEGTVRDEWEVGGESEKGMGEMARSPLTDDEVAAHTQHAARLEEPRWEQRDEADGAGGTEADAACQPYPEASQGVWEEEAAQAAAGQEPAEMSSQRGHAAGLRQDPATVDVMCCLCVSVHRLAHPTRAMLPLMLCCCSGTPCRRPRPSCLRAYLPLHLPSILRPKPEP